LVRGIGEDLLVAGERGVEDHLPRAFGGGTETAALEDRTVFQGENCGIQVRLFLRGSG
jgi:hypothetical protein